MAPRMRSRRSLICTTSTRNKRLTETFFPSFWMLVYPGIFPLNTIYSYTCLYILVSRPLASLHAFSALRYLYLHKSGLKIKENIKPYLFYSANWLYSIADASSTRLGPRETSSLINLTPKTHTISTLTPFGLTAGSKPKAKTNQNGV